MADKNKRIGRQDPTTAVILPYTETRGQEAAELYNQTKNNILEWQEALLYDIMAVDDEGDWIHQKFGYSVPRRNGKTEDILARCLWGLTNGEKILYTAHRTMTAHSVWERLSRCVEEIGLAVTSSYRAKGAEHIYTNSGRIDFRTRTSTGGLGEGFDLLIIDEAQEYTPEQETALKYVVTDSNNPQTVLLGTPPTAISAGTVFPKYRKKVLAGEGYDSGWAEWGVDKMSPCDDVDLWYETNPSLGTILKERTIRSEIGEDEIDFNVQRLGLWIKYNQKSAISRAEWDALAVDALPKLKGKLYIGIKYGHDGKRVSLSIAAKTKDGKIFTECYGCRTIQQGPQWIVDFLKQADWKTVAVDGDNGKTILADYMKEAGIKKKPKFLTVQNIIKANAEFEQALNLATITHMQQSAVEQIVSNCEKRNIGSKGGFGYQSILEGADVSILDSMIIAHWLAREDRGTNKQTISY